MMTTGCELDLKSCDLTSLCPIKGYYRGIPVTFRHSWDRILCEAATQHRAPKSFGAQDENGDQPTYNVKCRINKRHGSGPLEQTIWL